MEVFMKLSSLAFVILTGTATVAGLAAATAPEAKTAVVSGPWQEAVVSVSDLDRTAAFFIQVGGYTVRWRGTVPRSTLTHWQLPPESRGQALLLAPEGAEDGFVRLVRLEGVERVPMRPGARPWDTGCYFSLMLRGKDLDARYREAIDLGWWTESEIVGLSFGTSKLKNVIFKGPDGVNVAVYERLSPPLADFWPPFERFTQAFNTMQTVRYRDATHRFFTEVLGFGTFYKGKPFVASEPTYSNFSVPTELTTTHWSRAGIVHPTPGEVGRMEFIEFTDLGGEDYSDRCLPPNLGILSVRYPVADAGAARDTIAERGWPILYEPSASSIAPYGKVKVLAVQSPDGAMVELFSRE
jgi:catechol 2,3-dioxygenase-like lactoylglutathione lyase family enzyme